MRRKNPTSFTIHPTIKRWMEELQRSGGYSNSSELLAALIRAEHTRRFGLAADAGSGGGPDQPPQPTPPPAANLPAQDTQAAEELAQSVTRRAKARTTKTTAH